MNRFFAILFLVALTACGKQDYKPEPASFETCLQKNKMYVDGVCVAGSSHAADNSRYLLLENRPFTRIFNQLFVNVCVVEDQDSAWRGSALDQFIKSSVQQWLKPLQNLGVTIPMIIVSRGVEADCDATVHLQAEMKRKGKFNNRAFANATTREIWLAYDDVESGIGVVLHEFGHLFGLADTYIEGQWDCLAEFPNSLMCDSQWQTLLPIDEEQIRRIYCLETKGVNAACFNHQPAELLAVPQDSGLPYVRCTNGTDRFEIGATAVVHAIRQPYYSTDRYSVVEEYREGSVELTLRVSETQSVNVLWDGTQATVQFPDRSATYANCSFAPGILRYWGMKGVLFPSGTGG